MQRKARLTRKTVPVRKKSAPGNPGSSLRKVAVEQAKRNRKYYEAKDEYLAINTECMAQLEGCSGKATEVHHAKGRGRYLLVKKYFRAVCLLCHDKIENQPKLAVSLNLSLSRLSSK
jgi:hypothetical protein